MPVSLYTVSDLSEIVTSIESVSHVEDSYCASETDFVLAESGTSEIVSSTKMLGRTSCGLSHMVSEGISGVSLR
jgi:hypothetical protein